MFFRKGKVFPIAMDNSELLLIITPGSGITK